MIVSIYKITYIKNRGLNWETLQLLMKNKKQ